MWIFVVRQQQFGLVQGVPLSPSSRNEESSKKGFDAARAAMCLLKEEDHVWTIETCMETINVLRAGNKLGNRINEIA